MVEILVGAGGWSYFNVPGDRLQGYARAFKTVEVNSTYYRIPPMVLVEGWRRRVQKDFEFTVRCSGELTRRLQSEPLNSSLELFYRINHICTILRANILHIQILPTFPLNDYSIGMVDDFLSTISSSNLRLAWEIRSPPSILSQRLLQVLEKHEVIHCIDLSKETPAYYSDIVYSRLFGKGKHNIYQFTNDELMEIDNKVKTSRAAKVYLNFHGVKMYKDAARISIYEATGRFPKITSNIGVDSVLEVLKEDISFPSKTSELIMHQGWKVCEWSNDQQLRLSDILSRIDEKSFNNIHELESELHNMPVLEDS